MTLHKGAPVGIERIDKTDIPEYWQVAASTEAHKDKKQNQEESASDHFEALGEKTDWQLLLNKSQLWKKNIQVLKEEIRQVLFRKVNLKTDPSLLRVDIELVNGDVISPAFLLVSRLDAFKIKRLKSGDAIPENFLYRNGALNITIPSDPKLFGDGTVKTTPEPKRSGNKLTTSESATENRDHAMEATVKSSIDYKKWLQTLKQPITTEMLFIYSLLGMTLFFLVIGIVLLK